jgi:hypothetical protein
MSTPFVYVGTWTIKEGRLEEAKKRMAEHAELVEANEPRMIAFHVYFDEDAKTCSVVQLHPDSKSMEFHMRVMAESMSGAMDFIDQILTEQYFGAMSEELASTLAEWETPEVTVIKRPAHLAGFTRSGVR